MLNTKLRIYAVPSRPTWRQGHGLNIYVKVLLLKFLEVPIILSLIDTFPDLYENTPLLMYWKFQHQKPKVFR